MSSPLSLKEYRCDCGKLLFRSVLMCSLVEIKCKRCGEVRIFSGDPHGLHSFMLAVNDGGGVIDACEGVAVIGCSRQYVIGKLLLDILPLARDAQHEEIITPEPAPGGNYQIKNNTLLLGDRQVPLESYVVPVRFENGMRYRIFNLIREA